MRPIFMSAFLEQKLETLIKALIAEGKYDHNEKHILEENKNRGFSLFIIIEALDNGYLDELTAPTKV